MDRTILEIKKAEVYRKGDKVYITCDFINEHGVELNISGANEIEEKKGFVGYYYKD